MNAALLARTLRALAQLAATMALLLFVPAGTARWVAGWCFWALFVGASIAISLDLLRRDPALLERRLAAGPAAETRPAQKLLLALAVLAFAATLVVPALDRRWSWSRVPLAGIVLGDVLVALGLYVTFRVYRANSFAAATVRVEPGQRVIATGPYAVVRHPMYAGALLLLAGIPPALGSWWGLLTLPPMLATIIARLVDEERALSRELAGYDEYRRRVRHRLVPGVW